MSDFINSEMEWLSELQRISIFDVSENVSKDAVTYTVTKQNCSSKGCISVFDNWWYIRPSVAQAYFLTIRFVMQVLPMKIF